MNKKVGTSMVDELELSIKDMVMKLLLRWRLILLCTVIAGLVLGIVGGFLSRMEKEEVVIPQKQVSIHEQVETLKSQLTKEDAYMVRVAVDLNNHYMARQKYLTEYIDNSILMNLNADNVPTLEKMYQIHSNSLEQDKWNAIAKAYAWKLDSTELYRMICNEIELPESDEFAKELVTIGQSTEGSFVITVVANDEAQCKQILKVVDKRIAEILGEMKSIYGEFEVSDLEENFKFKMNDTILKKQETVKMDFLKIKSKIPTLDDYFFGTQTQYFKILLSGYDEDAVIEEEEEIVEENYAAESTETVKKEVINKRYAVIGAVLGFVMGCGYVVVTYIFSTKLRKKDDLQLVYGIPTLISIRSQSPKKKYLTFIDKLIYIIFNGKETDAEKNAVDNVAANIKMITMKKEIETVYLLGTYNCPEIESFVEEVKSKIDKELHVECGQFDEANIENLEKMLKTEMVFMFEATGLSKNKNIQRVIDICQLHGINIGGNVIFDTY